jgi:hypothetical protein
VGANLDRDALDVARAHPVPEGIAASACSAYLEAIATSFAAAEGLDVEAVNGRQSLVPGARSST